MSQHTLDTNSHGPAPELLRTGFQITSEAIGSAVVLSLHGELDMATAVRLRQALGAALEGGPAAITLDLAQLTFVDSTGIGTIVGACHRGREVGCSFSLRHPTRSVMKALRLTGVDQLMPIEIQPPLS